MKLAKQLFITSSLSVLLFTACGGGSETTAEAPKAKANLERILEITASELKQFEEKHKDTNKEKAMDDFSLSLAETLNATEPKVYPKTLGVIAEKDGSFTGFVDKNVNKLKDSGEPTAFKVEIDGEKQKLIASDSERSAESGIGGMMMGMAGGMMMGMLMGSLMNRQSATNTRPGANTPPRRSANAPASSRSSSSSANASRSSSTSSSAKSRSGSGSFSSGK
ncbi:MAG: hypothetical protein KAH00_08975 [Cocleimonas sp.]|nr:hypothetical protein [Cocleimonas sp.]